MDLLEQQKVVDDEHLRLLALGHLIDGIFTLAISLLGSLYFGFLYFIMTNIGDFKKNMDVPRQQMHDLNKMSGFFDVFLYIAGALIALGVLYGIAKIISSQFIKKRKYRMFSYIIAIPGFLAIPYGTLLSIATVIVLGKQTVKYQYRDDFPEDAVSYDKY